MLDVTSSLPEQTIEEARFELAYGGSFSVLGNC